MYELGDIVTTSSERSGELTYIAADEPKLLVKHPGASRFYHTNEIDFVEVERYEND